MEKNVEQKEGSKNDSLKWPQRLAVAEVLREDREVRLADCTPWKGNSSPTLRWLPRMSCFHVRADIFYLFPFK